MTASRQGLRLLGRAAFVAALATAALWAAGWAAERGYAPPKGEASELDAVPADGLAMVSLRFADLWSHPALKSARAKLAKDAPDFLGQFTKEVGVAPDDVERITGVIVSLESGGNWVGLVTTTKPYDSKKVLASAAPDAKEEKVKERTLYANPKGPSFAFVTDRTFAIGSAEELRRYLGRAESVKEGPLTPALREAAGKHLVVAGLDVEMLAKMAPPGATGDELVILPLLKARKAVLTADLGDEAKAEATATFDGEADAKNGEKAALTVLDMARAGMVKELQEAGKQPGMARVVALLEDVQGGLRAAKVERNGTSVAVTASVKIDADKTGPDLINAIQKVREQATRMTSVNNLKQLVLAMHNYQAVNGRFPASATYDKNGKPLLSWRVAILPYIEQDALYKQFHLDEPWDSDNNKKLMEQMPPLFGYGDEQALKSHETHYQGFVGKGAFFEGKKGVDFPDITDGTSNTIMLVEAAKTVPWTKPDDVPFDEGKLLPKVGGLFDGIFNAAMCDGSVRTFPLTMKEETLRALLTRNGGEVVDPNK